MSKPHRPRAAHKKSVAKSRSVVERLNDDAASQAVSMAAREIGEHWHQVRSGMVGIKRACAKVRESLSPKEIKQLLFKLPFGETTFRKHAGMGRGPRPRRPSANVEAARREAPHAYTPWTDQQEKKLRRLFKAGQSIEKIAKTLQRPPGGIRGRLEKLGLITGDRDAPPP
jgi:hypothetical protein